jgi:kynurenine formamidase
MPTLFDLTHPLENNMTFYPGDPQPRIAPAPMAAPWRVTELRMGTHSGTHVDAASHFIPDGKTIDEYPVERFWVTAHVAVVEAEDDQPIPPGAFDSVWASFAPGHGVLICTGWSRHWNTDRYLRHPHLSPEASKLLVARGVTLVGIDALSVDSTAPAGGTSHAHEILLGNDMLIVENLIGLEQLAPGKAYRFMALPLRLAGLDGSPVRAVAWAVISDQ